MFKEITEKVDKARWSGNNEVSLRVVEVDALMQEIITLRQQKIQQMRDNSEELNANEKLVGFLKLGTLQDFRSNKQTCGRILRFKTKEFVIPVHYKMSALMRILECHEAIAK